MFIKWTINGFSKNILKDWLVIYCIKGINHVNKSFGFHLEYVNFHIDKSLEKFMPKY